MFWHEKCACLSQGSFYVYRKSSGLCCKDKTKGGHVLSCLKLFCSLVWILEILKRHLNWLSLPSSDSFCANDSDGPSHCVLIPRGCPPSSSSAVSPSIPIPTTSSLRCSPNGALVFSNSPTSYLPPLPFGSAPRRNHSPKNDIACSPGSLRLSSSTRNSATSLLSMSTCSDTSYIMGR